MSAFLLDTNCISEVVRPRPNLRVIEWLESTDESLMHLSVLTLGEIRKGIASLEQGKRRARLEAWLETELQSRFAGRILPVDVAVADRWGLLAARARREGVDMGVIDGLLAATAMHYNLTFVSRNIRDLASVEVPVLNPWEP